MTYPIRRQVPVSRVLREVSPDLCFIFNQSQSIVRVPWLEKEDAVNQNSNFGLIVYPRNLPRM